jgi:hypothetical protein
LSLLILQLERNRLLPGNVGRSRRPVDAHRSVEHRERGLRPVHLESNVTRRRQLELSLAKLKVELIASCLQQAHIGRSLHQAHGRDGCTPRKTIKLRELHDRASRDSQGAVIFELNLGNPHASLQPAMLHNRKVRHDGLITVAGVAIQLN